jgi:RNA polymerase sigma factor for flagellar operon FliA
MAGDDDKAPIDVLEDPDAPDPFVMLEAGERRALLGRFVDRLPERERQVLALYYHEELTMNEIGSVLGVTESRVSQIHSSAILRLQAALRRERLGARALASSERRTRAG